MNEFTVRLDLAKGKARQQQTVFVRQGDKNATTIVAAITDHGTAAATSGLTARFQMRLPDGTHYYRKAASLSGNVATVALDEAQAASAVGRTDTAYFQLLQGSTVVASTESFTVIVLPDALADATVPESYDSAIQEAIDNANAAAGAAWEAAQQTIPDGSITPAKLASGAVTADKIADAVRKGYVRSFETVAAMQAATDLKAGMTCHTNGFHASGDNGAAYYAVSDTGTANGMDVLALQNGLFASLLADSDFMSIRQFGAYGDGSHDDTNVIQYALNKVSSNGGGTIYFPSGTYNLSDCVYIGNDVKIVGDGASTYFYGTVEGTHMGVFLAVAGSNVTIDNIGGSYLNGLRSFYSEQANVGLIGIGAYTVESGIAYNASGNANDLVRESHEYITISNLFCQDCTYPLQTEAPNPDGITDAHIHYVTYENIQAPHGVVSIMNRGDNVVDYVTIHNVVCAFLRVGNGWLSHVAVSDCICQTLWCAEINATVNNVIVDYNASCDIARWVVAGTYTRYQLLYVHKAIVSNVTVKCDNSDMTLIYCDSTSDSLFINVKASGGDGTNKKPIYVTQSLGTGIHVRFVNCDFSGVACENTNKPIMSGAYSNCVLPANIDTSNTQIFADNVRRPIAVTFASGIQDANSAYSLAKMSYATGTEVHVKARLAGTFANGTELFTLSPAFAPVATSYIVGYCQSSTGDIIGDAIIAIDTNGVGTVVNANSSTSVAAVLIDSVIMRKPICFNLYA